MIISQTPLRASLVGGGSDLPAFYRRFGGAVLCAAIDKYVYVTVNPKFDHRIRVSYSVTEEVDRPEDVQHPLVNAVLRKLAIPGAIEITSIADIPGRGTGLGSSSAFTVGLLNAVHAHRRDYVAAAQLAEEACDVELVMCGDPVGRQDQYAAAFGGLRHLVFHEDDRVTVETVAIPDAALARLNAALMLFYTGTVRDARPLLRRQADAVAADAAKQDALKAMAAQAAPLRRALEAGEADALGEALEEAWRRKRCLSDGIATPAIDDAYARARAAGAAGGKLLGAGGGGFLLFYVPPDRQPAVARVLAGLKPVPLRIGVGGSKIMLNTT